MKKDSVLLALLLFIPIFSDQFSGFILTEFGIKSPVSLIFKGFILAFFILGTLIAKTRRYINSMLIILSIILFYSIYYTLIDLGGLLRNIQFIIEVFMFPLSYLFFSSFFKKEKVKGIAIEPFFKGIAVFIFISLLLSVFGFGIPSYGKTAEGINVGYKGYFIAGNELSSLILLLASVIIYKHNFSIDKPLILLVFASVVLIGSKTLIFGVVLIVLLIPLLDLMIHCRIRLVSAIKQIFIFLIFLVPAIIAFFIFSFEYISPLVSNFVYKYSKHNDLITFLLSSRNTRITPFMDNYFNETNFFEKLFGIGYSSSSIINEKMFHYGLVEIDLFDLLGNGGLCLVGLTYYIWLSIFLKLIHAVRCRKSYLAIPVTITFVLLFVNSFIAGHILHSSMISIYLGCIVAYVVNKKVNRFT